MGNRGDDPACNSRATDHEIYTLDLLLLAEISKYKCKAGDINKTLNEAPVSSECDQALCASDSQFGSASPCAPTGFQRISCAITLCKITVKDALDINLIISPASPQHAACKQFTLTLPVLEADLVQPVVVEPVVGLADGMKRDTGL
ncbi:hypothetical protein WISP_112091 [Willisornis vidua]|uniref:Uncharacterized protein n=1 Tax=Willisornis vidua TaxID=1566151 RepID=A0ABQ9CW66_9PASS|nr:hypothetical protein WISP_112091 [Willisornis vidua]